MGFVILHSKGTIGHWKPDFR